MVSLLSGTHESAHIQQQACASASATRMHKLHHKAVRICAQSNVKCNCCARILLLDSCAAAANKLFARYKHAQKITLGRNVACLSPCFPSRSAVFIAAHGTVGC